MRVPARSLSTIVEKLPATIKWSLAGEDVDVTGMTIEHTEVQPGDVFVARKSYWDDSHQHIDSAIQRGAAAIVVSRAECAPGNFPSVVIEEEDPFLGHFAAELYGHPTKKLWVAGVTGTNGKTSTTWIIRHLLMENGHVPAWIGTVDMGIGEEVRRSTNTTPDASITHRFAAEALAKGAHALVLEVSSHGLAIGRLAGIAFDAVGFTNLTQDHLDFHGSMEEYYHAKEELFTSCLDTALSAGKTPLAVAAPGEFQERVLEATPTSTQTIALGTRVALEANAYALDKTSCTLRVDQAEYEVALPLIGPFNVENAGVALAMTSGLVPWPELTRALTTLPSIPGRLQRVASDSKTVFVDYAHTPDAVARVTDTVRRLSSTPFCIVIGCGGDRDKGKRPLMARAAQEGADFVILTSDNPRSEAPEAILADMRAGLVVGEAFDVVPDRAQAIAQAMQLFDTVLIAGKGHEATQEINGIKHPFSDIEVARSLL